MKIEFDLEDNIFENDKLFYHISRLIFAPEFNFSDIPPHAFTPQEDGNLSVNWEKYCATAEDCMNIKTERYPLGRSNLTHGIGHFITKEVREIEFLQVVYSETMMNKSHCHIEGIPLKKPKEPYNEMRKKLKRIFKYWDIEPINK